MNVVFDFGNVIFRWDPVTVIAGVFEDETEQEHVMTHFIGHDDWQELDRGSLRPAEAISRAAARTGLPAEKFARLLSRVPASLAPIKGSPELLYRVKAAGNWLYFLSNMHAASIEYLERAHVFWDVFEGGVISCRVRLIKPEPQIYAHLLSEYGLAAADTVFIDDLPVNLAAAAEFGMRTIQFVEPAQCERELRTMGCL
ncbi:MAG: HAD family hydrolase [Burkholderiales bacterium]